MAASILPIREASSRRRSRSWSSWRRRSPASRRSGLSAYFASLEGADAVEIRFFSEPENSEDYTAFKAVKLLYADSDHDIAILVAGIAAPPRRVLYCCHEASPVGHPADRAPGRPGAHRATRHRVHLG